MIVLDTPVPIRRIADIRNGGTPTADAANWGGAIPWATPKDVGRVHGGYLNSTERTITEVGSSNGAPVVPPGSVILSTRAPVGYIAITTEKMAFNQGCRALIPHASMVSSQYLSYALQSSTEKLTAAAQGTTFLELSGTSLSAIRVPLPPRERQQLIVDYLDRETAEIDAFIADQNRLIELLDERRAATITHAVTKGLDPTVPMKDSGIDWVGSIPNHWVVNRFSRCVRINSGQINPEHSDFSDLPLIAPNHVESGTGRIIELETAAAQGAHSGKYFVQAGQVVYSKIRPNLMKTVIAPCDCLCSADMYGLEADINQLGNKFLMYLLLSRPFHDYAVDQSMRVAMPKLNQDTLGAAPMWIPPLVEQEHIVNFLKTELAVIDKSMKDAREAIALSRERRAALISAAVTGQIDVSQGQSRSSADEMMEEEVRV